MCLYRVRIRGDRHDTGSSFHGTQRNSNAELSGGAAVRLSAGLERGGAVNDEYEKNSALGTPAVFQTLNRITVPEPFTGLERQRKTSTN